MSGLEEQVLCSDCGVDTAPCTQLRGCRHKGLWEYYMVHDEVWSAAQMRDGYLCIGCLEARLGYRLTPGDFTEVPLNDPDNPWHTPRLADRLATEEVWV